MGKVRAVPTDANVDRPMPTETLHPCTQGGCTSLEGAPCEYVDRRGRECRTAWCIEHRVTIEDHVYCRRHAGVVSALPSLDSSLAVSLPDLDNRAPSLVGWVSRQIDGDVWRLLLKELSSGSGGQLVADPVTLIFVGIARQRAWERAWRLDSHLGIAHRVSIVVEELDDTMITVKVGGNTVEQLVPPWIQHRVRGESVAPDEDRKEREEFYQRVLELDRTWPRARSRSLVLHRRGAPHLAPGWSGGIAVTRGSILIVDDDPRLLHIVAMYLGIEGYDVSTAENGEDGLAQVEARAPDLVILDIMMPGMDGIETCKRIRGNTPTAEIPIVMFSALSSDDDIERARLAGANHLITKPFNLVGLGSVVKTFFPADVGSAR